MAELTEVLGRYTTWGEPRMVRPGEFVLGNTVGPPAPPGSVERAWPLGVSPEAAALWAATGEAWLFRDVQYGQWGLHLLPPDEGARVTARERSQRPSEARPDDVVVGEFLGDLELVVLAPSEAGDRRVLVALPLDKRDEWSGAGPSLADFLDRYYAAEGAKFWE